MKYQINSTGNVILADQAFMDAVHAGDYTQLPDDPVPAPEPASRILTHLEFRRRFTSGGEDTEQELCDELEVTFESNPALTVGQKRALRTGYKNFYAASNANLDDPAIPPMLGIYVALGILTPNRPAEILA